MYEIPKIIHQIWIGHYPYPEQYKKYADNIRKLNPDWEYKLWTNTEILSLKLINKRFYKSLMGKAKKDLRRAAKLYRRATDVLRFDILYKYGGLYIDCDFSMNKSVNPIISDKSVSFICCSFPSKFARLGGANRLSNGILFGSKHNLICHNINKRINLKYNKKGNCSLTPRKFTTMLKVISKKNNVPVTILDKDAFFPEVINIDDANQYGYHNFERIYLWDLLQ